jgi:hypothetical protein
MKPNVQYRVRPVSVFFVYVVVWWTLTASQDDDETWPVRAHQHTPVGSEQDVWGLAYSCWGRLCDRRRYWAHAFVEDRDDRYSSGI